MDFNPFRNRASLNPIFIGIIAIVLWSLGFKEVGTIVFILSIIWYIAFRFIRIKKKQQKDSREKEFQKYVKRTGAAYLSSFDKPFQEGIAMQCFAAMENPSFYNIIDKSDDENGTLYVGELEWTSHMDLSFKGGSDSTYATRVVGDSDGQQVGNKSYATMCIVYDKGFRLPNFDLSRETLGKKAAEVLKLNKTLDIDFDEDKRFSDAWWLTTNETIIVKDLFNKNIRASFMKYVNKDYRISGQGNMIILITKNVLLPDEYSKVVYDMRAIQRTLRTNQKFYTPPKNNY